MSYQWRPDADRPAQPGSTTADVLLVLLVVLVALIVAGVIA